MPRCFVSPAARSSSAVNPFSRAFAARPCPGERPRRNSFAISSPRPRLDRYSRTGAPAGPSQRWRSKNTAAWSSSGEEPLPLAPRLIGLRGALLVLERDAEPLREPLDRADEVEALGFPHERDDVTSLAAAEAVVDLRSALTEKLGDRSSWNGQRPV